MLSRCSLPRDIDMSFMEMEGRETDTRKGL